MRSPELAKSEPTPSRVVTNNRSCHAFTKAQLSHTTSTPILSSVVVFPSRPTGNSLGVARRLGSREQTCAQEAKATMVVLAASTQWTNSSTPVPRYISLAAILCREKSRSPCSSRISFACPSPGLLRRACRARSGPYAGRLLKQDRVLAVAGGRVAIPPSQAVYRGARDALWCGGNATEC